MAQTPGRTCPNCGVPIEPGQRFCTNCGVVLEAQPPSGPYGPPQPQPQPPTYYPQQPPQAQVPPYAQQQQVPLYAQQPQQQRSPIAEALGALGLLFLFRRYQRRGYRPQRQRSSCCGCLVLLFILLVIAVPIYLFFPFRSAIPGLKNLNVSSITSGTNSNLTKQPPITTVPINEAVPFAGVDITIVNVQQSKAFLDDNFSRTDGMVRLNIKESNNSRANFLYSDIARLILPDKSSVAPTNERQAISPGQGETRTNWLDFPVPTNIKIDQLTLRLGTASQAQEDIPLTGHANVQQYQPLTTHPNVTTQYAGLTWTITTATVAWSSSGKQADKGMRFVTVELRVDNPTARDFRGYLGDYIRLKAGDTTSSPTPDSTFPLGFPANSAGGTGTVIFLAPEGISSYTLILLGNPNLSPPINQATADFQVK